MSTVVGRRMCTHTHHQGVMTMCHCVFQKRENDFGVVSSTAAIRQNVYAKKSDDILPNTKWDTECDDEAWGQFEIIDEKLFCSQSNNPFKSSRKRNILQNENFIPKKCKREDQDINPHTQTPKRLCAVVSLNFVPELPPIYSVNSLLDTAEAH